MPEAWEVVPHQEMVNVIAAVEDHRCVACYGPINEACPEEHSFYCCTCDDTNCQEGELKASDFPTSYKLQMIRAYPVIAEMTADEEYFATADERDAAFGRILRNTNLRRTHEMFLEELT